MAATELYDPAISKFSAGPSMGTKRSGHSAVLLHDGRVLVLGGLDGTGARLASAEVYGP
jgi:hypothetical protein